MTRVTRPASIAENPQFSLRALAKDSGLSSAALSEVVAAKRKLSQARATELVLQLPEAEAKRELLDRTFAASGQLKKLKQHEAPYAEEVLPPEFYDLLADWRYFATLSLLRSRCIAVEGACPLRIPILGSVGCFKEATSISYLSVRNH